MQGVLDKHYTRLADNYDQYLYYSPDFVRTLTSRMIEKLNLSDDDHLVDLGCGTGMYTLDILEQVALQDPVLGVDPYDQMLAQIPVEAPIARLPEDALSFSERTVSCNKILIKETIHHVRERSQLFANLHRSLRPGGVLLLVHVPPVVRYPLFQAALDRCRRWHADPDELVRQLTAAGFQVQREGLEYTHSIPKQHYFKMVGSCYMSVLTSFDSDELATGLQEMETKYREHDVLEFVDHFDFITAVKK